LEIGEKMNRLLRFGLAISILIVMLPVAVNAFEEISDWHDLRGIDEDTGGDYILVSDLDSGSDGYNNYVGIGNGWDPIDDFSGTFDGQGHTISDLEINRPNTGRIGLFGETENSAIIKNVGLVNVDVTGNRYVGGLVGHNHGNISNCYTTGIVEAKDHRVGGLVGLNQYSGVIIKQSYSMAEVRGGNHAGGLVGNLSSGEVKNSYSTGYVDGNNFLGGLIGTGDEEDIENSYWDINASGMDTSAGGEGKTTGEMKEKNTYYPEWDIEHHAIEDKGDGYPFLSWEVEDTTPTWYIYREETESYFKLEITSPEPEDEVDEGETVTVEYTVENTGDEEDTQEITFYVNDDLKGSNEHTIKGGENDTGSFTWEAEGEGAKPSAELKIKSEDDEDLVNIEIIKPYFDVNLDKPSEGEKFKEYEEITIEYTVENTGREQGTQTIEITVGDKQHSNNYTLNEGEKYTNSIEWEPPEHPNENYEIKITSEDETDEVNIQIEKDAFFKVTILSPEEGEVLKEGSRTFVDIKAENLGGEQDTQNIELLVNDDVKDTIKIEDLGAYEAVTRTLAWKPEEHQDKMKVKSEDHEHEINIKVEKLEESYFQINITEPQENTIFTPGEEVKVEYTIENIGGETDEKRTNFYVEGELEEYGELITIAPGETYSDSFTWTAEEPFGEKNLQVKNPDEEKEVTITVESETKEYELKVNIEGEGETNPEQGTHTVQEGQEIDLKAIPAQYWQFNLWTGETGNIENVNSKETTINIEDNYEITAEFTEKPKEPNFQTTITSPTEDDTLTTEEKTIQYTVENTGREQGTQQVEFTVNDQKIYSQNYTLEPGETRESNFTWTPEEGDQKLQLKSEDHTYTVNTQVIDAEKPFFTVKIDSPEEQKELKKEQETTVEYTLENIGSPGTQTIEFLVNNNLQHSDEDMMLEQNEEKTKQFKWIPEQTGEQQLTVKSENHQDSVTITVKEEPTRYKELTINIEGNGTTKPEPGTHKYPKGSKINIRAIETEELILKNWTGDIEEINHTEISILMDSDKEITANFVKAEPSTVIRTAAITTTIAVLIIVLIYLFTTFCRTKKQLKEPEEELEPLEPKAKLPEKLRKKIEERKEEKPKKESEETKVEKEENYKELGEEIEKQDKEEKSEEEGETLESYKLEEEEEE